MSRRILVGGVIGALLAGGLVATSPWSSALRPTTALASSSPWLDRLNAWRANAAVGSVTESATYDAGDYDHAVYMVENDLVTHYETAGTPYYTTAGDTAAQNSNIYVSSSTSTTDVQAIDWWMGAPFHAMAMVDPRLSVTGFGSYRQVKSGWQMGAALNVIQGNSFSGGHFPVMFPGDGTSEPLTTYSGNEFPDPLQACSGYSTPTGLPVFVEVGGGVATTVSAHSFTGNGAALDHCVIDSTNATLSPYLKSRGAAIIVPRAPLQSGVKYTASLTVNGTPYTWSFTVGTMTSGVWSASYDMSAVPTAWIAGATKTFPITVTNTGNQTWPSTGYTEVDVDFHFSTVTGGSNQQSSWLTSQALSIPNDIAPGASAAFNVTVTAPSTPGSMFLEAEMIKEHQFWFTQVASVPVALAAPVWSAAYNLSVAPTSWVAGQAKTFSVTVTNTGDSTWPATGYTEVDVDFHFTTVTGGSSQQSHWLTSQALSIPGNLAPAASATFNVTITAPSTAGPMFLEAEMIKEHQFWFTQVSSVPVTVAAAVWSASYNLSSVPATWSAGQSQTFSVTVTNTGNVSWPSTGYYEADLDFHFTTITGGSAQQSHWLTSLAFSLPNDVAPGTSVTFNVTVTAPTTKGSMFLEAEMIKEHQFWFTQVAYTAATVA